MNKLYQFLLISSLVTSTIVGCGGGSSSNSNPNSNTGGTNGGSSSSTIVVPSSLQVDTPLVIGLRNAINYSYQNNVAESNSCFVLQDMGQGKNYALSYNSSQWWSTVNLSYTIQNTCSTAQGGNLDAQIKGFKVNGAVVPSISAYIANTGNPYISAIGTGSNGNFDVTMPMPQCSGAWCSWAQIPAGASKTFTVEYSLSQAITNVGLDSITLNGVTPPPPPPVESGSIAVNIDGSSLASICTSQSSCNMVVTYTSAGLAPESFSYNPYNNLHQNVILNNLNVGDYSFSVANVPANVTQQFLPSLVTVLGSKTSNESIIFTYNPPVQVGNVTINLAKITNPSDYADLSQATQMLMKLVDESNASLSQTCNVNMGNSCTFSSLPVSDGYHVEVEGVGDAKTGVYYNANNLPVKVFVGKTTPYTVSYNKLTTNLENTNFSVSGLDSSNIATVQFVDNNSTFKYVANSLASGTYTFVSGQTVAVNASLVSGYLSPVVTPAILTAGISEVNVVYKKNTPPVAGKYVETYWSSWGYNTSYSDAVGGQFLTESIALTDIPSSYNVIAFAFLETAPGTNATPAFSKGFWQPTSQVLADIKTVQSRGQKVIVSIGGENATFNIQSSADVQTFVSTMEQIIDQYGFDGIDLDVEAGSMGSNPVLFGQAILQVAQHYRSTTKPYFMVTAAPEWPLLTVGGWYSNMFNAIGMDNVTVIWPQFYNQGATNPINTNPSGWTPATPLSGMDKFIEAGVWAFATESGAKANNFMQIPIGKLAIGLPATNGAAGGAGVYLASPQQMITAWNYLVQNNNLTPAGFMNWSADFDAMNLNVGNPQFNHTPWSFGNTASSLVNSK